MRIVHIITRTEMGGAQTHVLALARHFAPEVIAVAAGADPENVLEEPLRQAGVAWIPLQHLVQPLRPVQDLRAVSEIAGLLRRLRPDLVHLHSSKAGVVGRVAARLAGVPSVFTAHGWAFAAGSTWARKAVAVPAEVVAGRLGDRIIVVSEADRRLAVRFGIGAGHMTLVRNGIEDAPGRADPVGGDEVRLLMVARFTGQKDHATLVRALQGVEGRWRLLFAGDGPLRGETQALAASLGLAGRIDFLGNRNDVPELLSGSQVFVLSSRWEGLPISILEGMRAGLPIVASDVGGVAETIEQGVNGFHVPSGDVEALRGALQRVISDPDLRRRQGQASRARFEREFTAARMYRETRQVYEALLAGGAAA